MKRLLPFWGLLFLSACSTPRAEQLVLENPLPLAREDEPFAIALSRLGAGGKALPLLKKQPLPPLPLFQQCVGLHPVLTGRLYHDSIFAARVQGLL